MAEDWKLVGDEFANNTDVVIAEVDCTNQKSGADKLCEENEIQGLPTLKYGEIVDLDEYDGERDYISMSSFAKDSLRPVCGPANLDLCDDEMKATIDKFMKMSDSELSELITEKEKKLHDAKKVFEDGMAALDREYEEASQPESLDDRIIRVILEDREKVENFLKLSNDKLFELQEELMSQQEMHDVDMSALTTRLQETYEKLVAEHQEAKKNVKSDGYSLLVKVRSYKVSGNDEL